jgi:hypothetical protein
MRKTAIFLFFLVSWIPLVAQPPSWVNPDQRSGLYPAEKYLVSFKSELCAKDDNLENRLDRMLKLAKTDLVEQIHVNISSTATLNLENLNTKSLEVFRQASTSTSEASLTGLKSDTWFDKKKREAFVIVWINIADVIQASKADLADKETRVNQKIESAEKLAATGDLEKSLSAYYACFPLLRSMENDIAVMIALGKEPVEASISAVETKVLQGISALRKAKEMNLDQVCYFLADGLKQQAGERIRSEEFVMGSFTYEDSRMGSGFSQRLQAMLEQKLISAGFAVKEQTATRGTGAETVQVAISGTYWEEGSNLKIIVNIKGGKEKKSIASAEEMLPVAWLSSSGIALKPDNYLAAIERQKEMARTDAPSTGLQVDIWTNRGGDNPLFARGDTMLIYMQANRPCFIRLIYYLADGQKTLLADNYEIREDKAGKVFAFPDPFICDTPFGSEALQMAAQTEPFKPLKTKKENGYEFILDDVNGVLANTRGMKNLNKQLLHAEKRVEVTTIDK